jgi:hypothetical protein
MGGICGRVRVDIAEATLIELRNMLLRVRPESTLMSLLLVTRYREAMTVLNTRLPQIPRRPRSTKYLKRRSRAGDDGL